MVFTKLTRLVHTRIERAAAAASAVRAPATARAATGIAAAATSTQLSTATSPESTVRGDCVVGREATDPAGKERLGNSAHTPAGGAVATEACASADVVVAASNNTAATVRATGALVGRVVHDGLTGRL